MIPVGWEAHSSFCGCLVILSQFHFICKLFLIVDGWVHPSLGSCGMDCLSPEIFWLREISGSKRYFGQSGYVPDCVKWSHYGGWVCLLCELDFGSYDRNLWTLLGLQHKSILFCRRILIFICFHKWLILPLNNTTGQLFLDFNHHGWPLRHCSNLICTHERPVRGVRTQLHLGFASVMVPVFPS